MTIQDIENDSVMHIVYNISKAKEAYTLYKNKKAFNRYINFFKARKH